MTTQTPFGTQASTSSAGGDPMYVYPCSRAAESAPAAPEAKWHIEYTCEVMGVGKFQKTGIVWDGSSGRGWRLTADEGTYLKGSDLAPAPLMHWGAGLVADVTCRIAALSRNAKLRCDGLRVTAQQGFASKGSFVRAEAVAQVFDLKWHVEVISREGSDAIRRVVQAALAESPAVHAMTDAHPGTFALHANGRRLSVDDVAASIKDAPADPYHTYREMPVPNGKLHSDRIYTRHLADEHAHRLVLSNDSDAAIQWHIHAVGVYDFVQEIVSVDVGFPEVSGSSLWTLQSDANGVVAPPPLALFSVGTAFCYHTQLCRYVEVRHLPVMGARLVQTSRFAVLEDAGVTTGNADALDTHLFTNGRATDEETRKLLTQAERTCYAHRALATTIRQELNLDQQPA